jgi:hypothetical protein
MPKKSGSSIYDDLGIDGFEDSGSTFPRKLTAKHLPQLNLAFESLAGGLQDAMTIYKKGANSGRDGAGACLAIINLFLNMFEVINEKNLTTPLNSIVNSLAALKDNNQLPILTPVASSGRAKSSYMRSILEGWAVVTVERIMKSGIPLDKACEMVAKVLVKAGVKPSRGNSAISGRTVRNWKQRAAEDVEMIGIMAQAKKMLSDFIKQNDSTSDESAEQALEELVLIMELSLASELR